MRLVPGFVLLILLPLSATGEGLYDIRDFGATGDGRTLDTGAIQSAVDACAETGGRVIVPAGTYLTGTIVMKSGVTLEIASGAILLGSTNIEDYPEFRPDYPSYNNAFQSRALIIGVDLKDVAITGNGVIDGQGRAFPVKTKKRPDRYMNRPFVIWMVACRKIRIENVTLRNSAMWMQHYFLCEDLIIRDITVYNHCNQNNDMIDIDGCRNVTVSGCVGDTDDDALTIKSTSGRISENIIISDCILSSHCNAIKLGTESHGGFRNMVIRNCIIKPSERDSVIFGYRNGISGITLAMVDGGILEDISISDIRIDGPEIPLFMRLGDRARTYKPDMPRPEVGVFRNVTVSDITAVNAGSTGCSLTGLAGHPLENITLRNIDLTFRGGITAPPDPATIAQLPEHYPESTMFGILPAYGFFVRHVRGLTMESCRLRLLSDDHRPAVILEDVADAGLYRLDAEATEHTPELVGLIDARRVALFNSRSAGPVRSFISVSGQSDRITLWGNDLRTAGQPFSLNDGLSGDVIRSEGNIE